MKDYTVRELAKRLSCAIDWPKKPVGIRFIYSEDEYKSIEAIEPVKPINYCQSVRAATVGHCIKLNKKNSGCPAATIALGMEAPGEGHISAQRAFGNQLYHDLGTAKYSRDRQTLCTQKIYGVLVKPLEQYSDSEEPPQIIQIITNPYHAMRILQGYTYYYGIYTNFKMSGLQAVCSESTAYPYMSNNINISMLCGGTRTFCKWDDSEVDVSIPCSKFALTVEGVLRTMNLEDPDPKKAVARKKLKENGMDEEFPLEDGFNYCKLPQNIVSTPYKYSLNYEKNKK